MTDNTKIIALAIKTRDEAVAAGKNFKIRMITDRSNKTGGQELAVWLHKNGYDENGARIANTTAAPVYAGRETDVKLAEDGTETTDSAVFFKRDGGVGGLSVRTIYLFGEALASKNKSEQQLFGFTFKDYDAKPKNDDSDEGCEEVESDDEDGENEPE